MAFPFSKRARGIFFFAIFFGLCNGKRYKYLIEWKEDLRGLSYVFFPSSFPPNFSESELYYMAICTDLWTWYWLLFSYLISDPMFMYIDVQSGYHLKTVIFAFSYYSLVDCRHHVISCTLNNNP